MPRKASLLNVRAHLEHLKIVLDGIDKYGLCPAIQHELKVLALMNKTILRSHDAKRKSGDRKDLYITAYRQDRLNKTVN